jgi:hypothetical protein
MLRGSGLANRGGFCRAASSAASFSPCLSAFNGVFDAFGKASPEPWDREASTFRVGGPLTRRPLGTKKTAAITPNSTRHKIARRLSGLNRHSRFFFSVRPLRPITRRTDDRDLRNSVPRGYSCCRDLPRERLRAQGAPKPFATRRG